MSLAPPVSFDFFHTSIISSSSFPFRALKMPYIQENPAMPTYPWNQCYRWRLIFDDVRSVLLVIGFGFVGLRIHTSLEVGWSRILVGCFVFVLLLWYFCYLLSIVSLVSAYVYLSNFYFLLLPLFTLVSRLSPLVGVSSRRYRPLAWQHIPFEGLTRLIRPFVSLHAPSSRNLTVIICNGRPFLREPCLTLIFLLILTSLPRRLLYHLRTLRVPFFQPSTLPRWSRSFIVSAGFHVW